MIIETLSTFPGMYDSVMGASMMRRAQEKGILRFKAHDLRDWTYDRHRTTDDDPYGGGDGLVMKCAPLFEAVEAIAGRQSSTALQVDSLNNENNNLFSRASSHEEPSVEGLASGGAEDSSMVAGFGGGCGARREIPHEPKAPLALSRELRTDRAPSPEPASEPAPPHIIFLAPQGEPFTDAVACELAREERLLFVCGHYEGIDERAYTLADSIISLGDYVLTSGELASMVVIDAVVRKLPGVLGAETGAMGESFADGLLEYPQYTRPATFRGMDVPEVLLSGNHAAIARWRRQQSLERTARLRPDLLTGAALTPDDREFLQSLSKGTGA